MKMFRILSLATIVLIPSLAGAELPMTTEVLGKTEGIMDFCSKAVPQDAGKFIDARKQSGQGASEKELTEARNTKEYKEAYASVTALLTAVPQDQAVAVCTTLSEPGK